jgi:CheY-like chemotaxis protein
MNHTEISILLVDDSAIVRRSLRQLFEAAGFLCMEAENGAQGLELAERFQPNLVVLDFSMPIMNGLEAAPLFKQKFPETPIIMFTMFTNDAFAKVACCWCHRGHLERKSKPSQAESWVAFEIVRRIEITKRGSN